MEGADDILPGDQPAVPEVGPQARTVRAGGAQPAASGAVDDGTALRTPCVRAVSGGQERSEPAGSEVAFRVGIRCIEGHIDKAVEIHGVENLRRGVLGRKGCLPAYVGQP